MINRLPNGYARKIALPSPGSSRPATFAGETLRWRTRIAGAAATSIGSYPLASLGLALAAGILLGKLVKR